MGSLIISFIFTFNTLLFFFAASNPNWRWPPPGSGSPFKPPPAGRVDAKTFSQCMNYFPFRDKVPFSDFYDPKISKANFTSILNSTAQNFRCLNSKIRKPLIIFRPDDENQVPPVVWCAQKFNLNIRIRSGGHDYEGLSYISLMKNQPFMILDLYNLRDIDIDPRRKTAWVQAGATNGELYYEISQKSNELGFPAGLCTTLGFGGHLTGGAYGSMMRKHGLGADNVVDVRMVDYRGVVLSREYRNGQSWGREHMLYDLFWALRGGGGASFGIILAWKIKLVKVPSKVTMFTVVKSLQTNATDTLHQWQSIAPKLPNELFIRVIFQAIPKITVLTIYQALYLGNKTTLAKIMNNQFPALGVKVENCTEMSWIESVMNIAGFNTSKFTPKYLLQHQPAFQSNFFKAKSDFLMTNMSIEAINGMMNIFIEQGPPSIMIWNPYGGKMAKISADYTPFPHRKGVICKIQYVATWLDNKPETQLRLEGWMSRLYEYMTDYVSKNPRQAYVNYRDLDIGKNESSNCSDDPTIWGHKYFNGNFEKLVDVKTKVDPQNFFKHEQSIPTYMTMNQCTDVI